MASEKVKMQAGLTLNLGDYQSLRVDVGLEREGGKDLEAECGSMREELLEQLERSVKYFEKGTREVSGRDAGGRKGRS